MPLTDISYEYKVGSTVYYHSVQSTSAKKQVMEIFGEKGRFSAAGTYMMLHVKTAKFVEPFSQYANEEEYLTNFNTAFQVPLAAVSSQSLHAASHNSCRVTHHCR